jgi:hypothetical protein
MKAKARGILNVASHRFIANFNRSRIYKNEARIFSEIGKSWLN